MKIFQKSLRLLKTTCRERLMIIVLSLTDECSMQMCFMANLVRPKLGISIEKFEHIKGVTKAVNRTWTDNPMAKNEKNKGKSNNLKIKHYTPQIEQHEPH